MSKVVDLRGKTIGGTDKRKNVRKIARHHSATDSGDVFTFEKHWKNTLGWRTGGYHEVILRDGTVQLCYDSNVVTNGVYGHNQTTYHICLVGNGDFTDAQEKAFDDRVKKAIKKFGLSVSDVLGHREFSGASTACPGIDMDEVRDRLRGKPKQTPKKKPAKKKKSTKKARGVIADIQNELNKQYGFNIAVDNILGPETHKALVKAYQTELNEQYNAGLSVDGIWGPKTRNATVNVRYGARGKITWIMQALLVVNGYNISVDGIYGDETKNALRSFQKDNKLSVDAVAGKATWAKLLT